MMRDLRRDHLSRHDFSDDPGACFVVAAIVGGVATTVGAVATSSAANHASDVAQKTAADNNAAIQARYEDTKSLELPTINSGQAAQTRINALLGLGGDQKAADQAFQDYLGSSGYGFQMKSGVNAITSSRAATGSLDSGGTLKALTGYGQNLGQSYFSQYLGQVGTVADRGASATNALTGAGQSATNATVSNNNTSANAQENAALVKGQSISSLVSGLAGIYGMAKGQSSYFPTTGTTSTGGNTGYPQVPY